MRSGDVAWTQSAGLVLKVHGHGKAKKTKQNRSQNNWDSFGYHNGAVERMF